MTADVRIEIDGTEVTLHAPYNESLPPAARALGGRWDAKHKAWTFDARDEERVRDLARKTFGTDGSPETAGDLVTVRVRLIDHLIGQPGAAHGRSAEFGGRRIAERRHRDETVTLAPGVVLVEGTLPATGGSMSNPRIAPPDDAVVEIRDIPRAALSVEHPTHYQIVGEKIDTAALAAERDRLTTRIAEIDALLAR